MKIRKSYVWALVMLVGIAGWLASGMLMRADVIDEERPAEVTGETSEADLPTVRVATIEATERTSELVLRGRSETERRVELRAETAGRVVATPHGKGSYVETGAVLCELDMAERQARLAEARAAVDQTRLDYEAATALREKGYAAATEAAARKARYDAAAAALKQMEIEIDRTSVRAPFSGIIETQDAKAGAWLAVGGVCATLVDPDPMLIVGNVSERDVGKLSVGMAGRARLITGETVEGKIGFIASTADPATRTFRVELEVDNADRKLRAGVTAEIAVPLEATVAHRLSPAILTLDDAGRIGVRTVGPGDVVEFVPVTILADGADGVWVSGLPDRVTVITVGQEYVEEGQQVRPVEMTKMAKD